MRITPCPQNRENGKLGYYVRPSMRKKGYAKEMIEFARQYAVENSIDITAVADSNNVYSMKALMNAGWSKTGAVYDWKGNRKGVEFAPD